MAITVERYIVEITEIKGKREAKRLPLNVPVHAAIGHLEKLSDRALRDLIQDLDTERLRRFTSR